MSDCNATVEISGAEGGPLMFRLFRNRLSNFVKVDIDPTLLPPLSSSENVTSYGDTLRTALYTNAAIGAELDQMFALTAPDRSYLDFAITNSDAEPIRWEALHADPEGELIADGTNAFLALDGKCSLKRIALTGAAKDTGARLYALPIRMAAFLSPSGISAKEEFAAIAAAIGTARKAKLEIEAKVYLGEQDLLLKTAAAIDAGTLPGIRVEPIPHDAIGFEKQLLSEPFQIVHFFCHGRVEGGVQRLEFSSISDHDVADATGSVVLSIERLTEVLPKSGQVWLTVINSCSGGASTPRQHSMAGALVKSASPVAIGMAEPIQARDANRFATAFYESAFAIIGAAVKKLKAGSVARIDLGPAVVSARVALDLAAQAEKAMFGRWCLPILYQRDAPLTVTPAPDAEMQQRIGMVAQALRTMPILTPTELREQLLALLDKDPEVPEKLRPDLFGEF